MIANLEVPRSFAQTLRDGEAAMKRHRIMPPSHTSEVLLEDFLKPLGIS